MGVKYPKQVLYLLLVEFLTIVVYRSVNDLLLVYSKEILKYQDTESRNIRNLFLSSIHTFPLIGAMLADNWFGKYNTFLGFLIFFIWGIVSLTLLSIQKDKITRIVSSISAILLAIGYGGLKSCKYAILGDQFVLPEESKLLVFFFYVMIYVEQVGIFFARVAVSYLRNMHCIKTGIGRCYIFCFATDTAAAIFTIVLWLLIKRKVKHLIPPTHVVVKSVCCVFYALAQKFKKKENVKHWLELSKKEYGDEFVQNVKDCLNITCVFLPMVFFQLANALHYFWNYEGNLMNDRLDNCATIDPLDMRIIENLIVMTVIPLLWLFIFPLYEKYFNFSLLRCISVGMICTAASFFVSGYISYKIEEETVHFPQKGEYHLHFFNPLNCTVQFHVSDYKDYLKIEPMSYKFVEFKTEPKVKVKYNVTGCENTFQRSAEDFKIVENNSLGYYLTTKGLKQFDVPTKRGTYSKLLSIRHLVGNPSSNLTPIVYNKKCRKLKLNTTAYANDTVITPTPGLYTLKDPKIETNFARGGYYVVLVFLNEDGKKIRNLTVHEIIKHNKLSIFWQTPQYVVFALAESFILPTGIAFAYTQASYPLKATMIGTMFGMRPLGLLMYNIISFIYHFKKKSNEQFMYGTLGMIFAFIFIIIAVRYNYVENREEPEEGHNENTM